MKRKRSWSLLLYGLCMILIATAVYVPGQWTKKAYAYADPSSMTDQDFFGVWNAGSGTWTTTGKLNYATYSGLAAVQNDVKAGNYTQAKEDLLTYYKARTGHTGIAIGAANALAGDLAADNILTAYEDTPITTFTVTTGTYQTVSVDVASAVSSVLTDGNKTLALFLLARDKENSYAVFNSKEAATNKPMLELTIDGVAQPPIAPIRDTYTRAGSTYGGTNFGSDTSLYVQDGGAPYDDTSMRPYLAFDLSAYKGTLNSATLKLYGKKGTGTGTKEIVVYKTAQTGWSETGLTWNNQVSSTFSWNGVAGGPDWNQPSTGAHNEFSWLVARNQFLGPVIRQYIVTGNEQYAGNTIRLMLDFIADKQASYPRSLDVSFRAYVWPRIYAYLLGSTSFDANANVAILKHLWQTADWLAYDPSGFSGYNWAVSETKGLYSVSVYFPEFSDATGWKSLAKTRMDDLMATLISLDGGYSEGSTNYTYVTMQGLQDFTALAHNNGDTLSATFMNGLLKLSRFIMDATLPNGYNPVYGDGPYFDLRGGLLTSGNALNDPALQYFGSGGTTGSVPNYTSSYFPDNKSVTMRSGWTADDKFMYFTNRGGPHGHRDQNAVIAYGFGKVLLTDTGVNSYLSSDTSSNWQFNNVESHNTLKINNIVQDAYKTEGSVNIDEMNRFATNDVFDFAEGVTYANAGFTHTRDVLFLRPDYWIVSDHVTGGETSNHYETNWHLLPGANPTQNGTTKATTSHFTNEPNIIIVPADPSSVTASLADGYYGVTTTYNEKFAKYEKTVTGDASFDTVLYPLPANTSRNVTTTRLTVTPSVPTTVATALKVGLNDGAGGNNGYYYLSHEAAPETMRSYGSYAFDGKMAYAEETSAGALKTVALRDGKTLKRGGSALISSDERIGDMGVRWNGAALEISGGTLVRDTSVANAVAIYAPSATTVWLNGETVPFARSGDYVYAVRSASATYDAAADFGSAQGTAGWLQLGDNGSAQAPLTWHNGGGSASETAGTDSFASGTLGSQWSWVNEDNTKWSLSANPGSMRITTSNGDIWATSTGQKNILLQTPQYSDFVAETKLSFATSANYQAAGLILYVNDDNYIKVERAYNGSRQLRVVNEYNQTSRAISTPVPDITGDVYLRLVKLGNTVTAYYSADGSAWTALAAPLVNVPLINPRVGLEAMYSSGASSGNADFAYFNIARYYPARYSSSGDTAPMLTAAYAIPGASSDAVRSWVAPASGAVWLSGHVASHDAFASGDGVNVKVTKNGANVWPLSGWQTVAANDTKGYAFNELVPVAAGDTIAFVTNRNATTTNDVADWSERIVMLPGAPVPDASGFESGSAAGWSPVTSGRWTVGTDSGDKSYYINTSGYATGSGGRPGEYALRDGSSFDSFKLTLKARLGQDVNTVPAGNGVVIFNYQDANNYYFLRFDNAAAGFKLYKVKAGVAAPIADSNGNDWIKDNNYHTVTIDRNGKTGATDIYWDNVIALRAKDNEFRGGKLGVGSMDGSAYFDDIAIVDLNDRNDPFNASLLESGWSWVREDSSNWSLTAAPGKLRMTATNGDLWYANNNENNILLRKAPYGDFTLTTKLTFSPTANYQSAGLIVYGDDDNYIKVDRVYNAGNKFRIAKEVAGTGTQQTQTDTFGGTVYLKLVKAGTTYTGYYSNDNVNWSQINTFTGISLTNPRIGLRAQRSSGAGAINADFDYFDVTETNTSDNFDSAALGSQWSWVREANANWSLTGNPGNMRIAATVGDLWSTNDNEENLLLQSPSSGDYTLVTKVAFAPTANFQSAGLLVYGDDSNYIKVERVYNGGNYFRILKEIGGTGAYQTPVADTFGSAPVYLKLVKSGTSFSGYFSGDALQWTPIGTAYTGVSLTNPKVGLRAQRSGGGGVINADFDFFRILPN